MACFSYFLLSIGGSSIDQFVAFYQQVFEYVARRIAEQIYIASGHAVDLPCLGTSAAATNRHSAFFFRRILSFQWSAPLLTKVQVCLPDVTLTSVSQDQDFSTLPFTPQVYKAFSTPDLPDVDLWSVFCWSKYDTIQLFFNLRQTPLALFVLSKKMVKSNTYRPAADHSTGPLARATSKLTSTRDQQANDDSYHSPHGAAPEVSAI